jgi:arylformamidase
VRADTPCQLDLRYGPGEGETLDVFPAAPAATAAPVLVFIHGGWWRSLDKADHSFIAPPFNMAGAAVVMPNYALCPAVSIEHIALQMTRALAWVWRHAAEFGGDPARIVVAGHSAGGHLAAMLLCCRWSEVASDLPPGLVTRALAVSGVFDLKPLMRTPYLQTDLRLTSDAVRRLSPSRYPAPAGVLNAVAGGDESEEFLRHIRLIRKAWGGGVVRVCETVPGANHFSVLDHLADPASPLHARARALLGLR